MAPTRARGFSESAGFWKTKPIMARAARSSRLVSVPRSRPATIMLPDSAAMSRATALPSVVLPEPDSPTSPTVWPAGTLSVTRSTATSRRRPAP
jgi:hypothetical protein